MIADELFKLPQLVKARQIAENLKQQELEDITQAWGKAGHDTDNWFSYDANFQVTLGMPLSEWIDKRKIKYNQPIWVLDLLAPGEQNRHLDLTGGLSVTLADVRNPVQKETDEKKNLDVIEGNLFTSEFFKDIHKWMEAHKFQKFDLVMARPMGGLEDIPDIPEFYSYILDNILSITSDDDGLIILQLPWEVIKYLPNLQQKLGTQFVVKYTIPKKDEEHPQRISPVLMIVKKSAN